MLMDMASMRVGQKEVITAVVFCGAEWGVVVLGDVWWCGGLWWC